MKDLSPRNPPRVLWRAVLDRCGPTVRLSALAVHVGRWPAPLKVLEALERAGLARRVTTADCGRGKVLWHLAEPPKKVKVRVRKYKHKTAVTFLAGKPPEPCGSTRVPVPNVTAWVKAGSRVERVRFVGRVSGGWLVRPFA
jgi:hypothetical protein